MRSTCYSVHIVVGVATKPFIPWRWGAKGIFILPVAPIAIIFRLPQTRGKVAGLAVVQMDSPVTLFPDSHSLLVLPILDLRLTIRCILSKPDPMDIPIFMGRPKPQEIP